MISKGTKPGGAHFWTTIPEEKERTRLEAALKEAVVIGALITEQYSKLALL